MGWCFGVGGWGEGSYCEFVGVGEIPVPLATTHHYASKPTAVKQQPDAPIRSSTTPTAARSPKQTHVSFPRPSLMCDGARAARLYLSGAADQIGSTLTGSSETQSPKSGLCTPDHDTSTHSPLRLSLVALSRSLMVGSGRGRAAATLMCSSALWCCACCCAPPLLSVSR